MRIAKNVVHRFSGGFPAAAPLDFEESRHVCADVPRSLAEIMARRPGRLKPAAAELLRHAAIGLEALPRIEG